jgi:methylthioribose-1-phosphate isomerase
MGVVADIIAAVRGETAANRRLIIDGFKELMQEHKTEAAERKKEAAKLLEEVQAMRENELECRRQLAQLRKDFLDAKEELIFTKILSPKPPDHE